MKTVSRKTHRIIAAIFPLAVFAFLAILIRFDWYYITIYLMAYWIILYLSRASAVSETFRFIIGPAVTVAALNFFYFVVLKIWFSDISNSSDKGESVYLLAWLYNFSAIILGTLLYPWARSKKTFWIMILVVSILLFFGIAAYSSYYFR